MPQRATTTSTREIAEGTAGGSAGRVELRGPAPLSPADRLAALLADPRATPAELAPLLRHRRLSTELLLRVARDRRFRHQGTVMHQVALHPNTSLALARELCSGLYWRNLAEVAATPQASPTLRHHADMLLGARAPELTAGERIALARIASRPVLRAMLPGADGRVATALFDNPRMTENDALALASASTSAAGALAALANHPRWGLPRAVRVAIASNPRTPIPAALGLLRRLHPGDLARLAGDPRAPRLVRVSAERRLDAARGR